MQYANRLLDGAVFTHDGQVGPSSKYADVESPFKQPKVLVSLSAQRQRRGVIVHGKMGFR